MKDYIHLFSPRYPNLRKRFSEALLIIFLFYLAVGAGSLLAVGYGADIAYCHVLHGPWRWLFHSLGYI